MIKKDSKKTPKEIKNKSSKKTINKKPTTNKSPVKKLTKKTINKKPTINKSPVKKLTPKTTAVVSKKPNSKVVSKKPNSKIAKKSLPTEKIKLSGSKKKDDDIKEYKVGDYMAYPHHGAAKVTKIFKKKLKNKTWLYLKLKIINSDLDIEIPQENVKKLKIRDLVTKKEINKILKVIGSTPDKQDFTWSKRYKNSILKLATADVYKIAEIVRDLHYRSIKNEISSEERKMLAKTRKILVSEFTVALNIDEQKGHDLLNKALKFTPTKEEKEISIYGPITHNLSSFDTAGGIGIHRVKHKKKNFKMFESDEIDLFNSTEIDKIDELPEEDDILKEDSFDDEDDI